MFRPLILSVIILALTGVVAPRSVRAATDQVEEIFIDEGDLPESASLKLSMETARHPASTHFAGHNGKSHVRAAGQFVTTKTSCPMRRSPTSESKPMIVVRAEKKIWVENVDQKWVKGFNKAGESGFIDRSCVQ